MNDKVELDLKKVTVIFKSVEPYYGKEDSGVKNNTIRARDTQDPRFMLLDMMDEKKEYGLIRIVHKPYGYSFTRRIKDVSKWDVYSIITWKTE